MDPHILSGKTPTKFLYLYLTLQLHKYLHYGCI